MFVHIISVDGIYSKKYLEFVKKNFDSKGHVFVYPSKHVSFSNSGCNVKTFALSDSSELLQLFLLLRKADHVFLHGLFDWRLFPLLNGLPSILHKSSWVVWGGDLYNYWIKDKHSSDEDLIEKLKRDVVKNLYSIIGLVKEDYEFAKEKYKTNAIYRYAFYPNPINFELIDQSIQQVRTSAFPKILVGNSATQTNNHFEILKVIKKLNIGNAEIICPLSYGDKEYAKIVSKYGKTLFGDRFIPLMNFLPPSEYSRILTSVDVAIFAHRRQQALGNILALLYAGKKVYVRSDVSTWNFLNRLNITVFDTIKLLNGEDRDILEFNSEVGKRNREIVKSEFSEERCVQVWKNIFDEYAH